MTMSGGMDIPGHSRTKCQLSQLALQVNEAAAWLALGRARGLDSKKKLEEALQTSKTVFWGLPLFFHIL